MKYFAENPGPIILAHLASGLRVVITAHHANVAIANRVWLAGLTAAALISTTIIVRCAACGSSAWIH
jgi:hypothetical protein